MKLKDNVFVSKGFIFKIKIEAVSTEKFALLLLALINNKSSNSSSEILDVATKVGTNDISVLFSGEENSKDLCNRLLVDVAKNMLDGVKFQVEFAHDVEIVTVPYDLLEEEGVIDEPFALFVTLED